MLRIAVDCMGGDNAPLEAVKGAILAAKNYDLELFLVGRSELLNDVVKQRCSHQHNKIKIIDAEEVIGMDEPPVSAVRKKKKSSIVVATKLVNEGSADAVVSAGNTGAAMASSIIFLGRVKEVERPALTTFVPTSKNPAILLDVGANVDCKPRHLVSFARMGVLYAEVVLNRPAPRVGLLSIGEESGKGNKLTQNSFKRFEEEEFNFMGNIEGRDIFSGDIDVIVCDGFVGNIVIKTAEGLVNTFLSMLNNEIKKSFISRMGAFLMTSTFRTVKKKIDYSEYGGAPLLGVNGISIVAHGSSEARAFKHACLRAQEAYNNDLTEKIKSTLSW